MISLIIKGRPEEALHEASARSIDIHGLRSHPEFPETIAFADDKFAEAVRKWFVDAPYEAPYPVGTLTFYAEGIQQQ